MSYLEPQPDGIHARLVWIDRLKGVASAPAKTYRVGLRLPDLTLLWLDEFGMILSEYGMRQQTLSHTLAWLKDHLTHAGFNPDQFMMETPSGLAGGATSRFQVDNPKAFDELTRYFSNAHLILEALAAKLSPGNKVYCRAKPFDIRFVYFLDQSSESTSQQSICLGLSLGDTAFSEPYFYGQFLPEPDVNPNSLPELAGAGQWYTDAWFGTALPASQIVTDSEDHQLQQISNFLESTLQAVSHF
ncbi:MAG: hypothetical protein D6675_15090 [Gemmatimonadetes bacterium]|nr:MAG: hypothetical protein D6675_15090 [Gemmatimonadota bacterium]